MITRFFFRPAANRLLIDRLSGEIVAASRHPALYTDYGIEDSLEGRFESLALHAALVLRRLGQMPEPAPAIAQDLTDALFRSFDTALRETGIGDIRVPKHMKALARAFLGRADAYDRALLAGTPALEQALLRNVYDGRGNPSRLARYAEAATAALATLPLDAFLKGTVSFPNPCDIY